MASDQGLFVLGVQIKNIGQEIKKLEKLSAAAKGVAAQMREIGKTGAQTAGRVAFADDFEKGFRKVNQLTERLRKSFDQQAKSIKQITAAYDEVLKRAIKFGKETQKSTRTAKKSFAEVASEIKVFDTVMSSAILKIVRYRIAFGIWAEITEVISKSVEETIKLNQVMANLQKVMTPVITDFEFLANTAFGLGKRFGASVLDVAESMQVWAQQGNNMVQVAQLTESSLLAMNAANITAQEAVEALTAATKAYNISAFDSVQIVDKWIAVQARHAVSSQDLANGVKTVASAADAAGVDIDQLNGIIAAIGSVTRKTGREVANSFKTMLARLNRRATVDVFQNLGIAVKSTRDEMRPVANILGDLASLWGTLTGEQQKNIAITVGGIRRYTDFVVLMNNWQEFIDATADSFNALGESQLASQEQVESFSGRIQRLNTAFTQLGISIADPLLGDFLKTFATGIEGIANAFRDMSPTIQSLIKFFTTFGGILAGTAIGFGIGKIAALGFIKSLGFLNATLGLSVKSLLAFRGSLSVATSGTAAAASSIALLSSGIGTVAAVIAAIATLSIGINTATDSLGDFRDSFSETLDKMNAETTKLDQVTNAYKKQETELVNLIARKEQLIQEGINRGLSAAESEQFANTELIKSYKDLATATTELTRINTTNQLEFVFSNDAIQSALTRTQERSSLAYQTMITEVTKFRDSTQSNLDAVGKAIDSTDKLFELLNDRTLTPGEIFQKINVDAGLGGSVITQFLPIWDSIRKEFVEAVKDAKFSEEVGKVVVDEVNKAFEQLTESEITVDEFTDIIIKKLESFKSSASLQFLELIQNVQKFNNILNNTRKIAPFVADSYFTLLDASSQLRLELEKSIVSSRLFERDNVKLEKILSATGSGYDAAAKAVDNYHKQLEEIVKLQTESELEISILEQKVRADELAGVSKEILDTDKERLATLKREVLLVSDGFEQYKRNASQREAALNLELKKLEERSRSNETNAKIQTEVHQTAQKLRDAHAATNVELEKEFNTILELGGKYGLLVKREIELQESIKETNRALIAQDNQVFKINSSLRDYLNSSKELIGLAELRSSSEESILELQLNQINAQINLKKETAAKLGALSSDVQLNREILKLEEDREVLNSKLNILIQKRNVLISQANIGTDLDKQAAVSEVILAQIAQQSNSQIKILNLEKERTKLLAERREILLQLSDQNQTDSELINRRVELSKKLLDIEKQILLVRLDERKKFKDSLRETANELSNIISTGLGSFLEDQLANYDELAKVQQELANAERDRIIALKEGNSEALFDIDVKLRDLKKRQSELNSLTFQWKESLVDIGIEISSLANQKLAKQFVDSLFNISFGDEATSIGELIASGIIIKPALADFKLTATEVSKIFDDSIRDAGIFSGDYLYQMITRAVTDSGLSSLTPHRVDSSVDVTRLGITGGFNIKEDFTDGSKKFSTALNDAGNDVASANYRLQLEAGKRNAANMRVAMTAAVQLLANQLGLALGGGGRGAGIGSTFLGGVGQAAFGPIGGAVGSIVGGIFGGLFDKKPEIIRKPIFEDVTTDRPLPVSIEKFGDRETILHDVSVTVEANFLDPSQLDPISMRRLAQHVREETEQLLRRENIWGNR